LRVEQQIASLATIFTEKASTNFDSQPPFQAQYNLRGVGIGPAYETTFVYVDPAPLIDDSSMSTDGQWWRFEFPSHGIWDNKPTKKIVTEEEVLKEASDDAKEALLVYADRAACDHSNPAFALLPLSEPLQEFINIDNRGLQVELVEQVAEQQNAVRSVENDGWPQNSTTTYIDDINEQKPALPPRGAPPAYEDSQQHHEYVPDLKVEAPEDDYDDDDDYQRPWVADPGSSLVSDAEYAANMAYEEDLRSGSASSGRGVSTMQGVKREDGVDPYEKYRQW
jgi:hypothetical protein